MAGKYIIIENKRWTYVPAFVNERLEAKNLKPADQSLAGGAWSCTFAALMYGINFAFLGDTRKTRVSQQDIVDLARASGDPNLRSGGDTTQMLNALQKNYGEHKEPETVLMADTMTRLRDGRMVVAGLTAGKLSDHFVRFIRNRDALHRAAFVGFRLNNGAAETRIIDPMAVPARNHYPDPRTYAGEWFPLTEFAKAVWMTQQVWFDAGEFLGPIMPHEIRAFDQPRRITFLAGAVVDAYDPIHPQRPMLRHRFGVESNARFNRLVGATVGGVQREYVVMVDGFLKGKLIPLDTDRIEADVSAAAPPIVDAPIAAPEEPEPPLPLIPDLPGREGPPDGRTTPLDNVLDDDPEEVGPPDEDRDAVEADAFGGARPALIPA